MADEDVPHARIQVPPEHFGALMNLLIKTSVLPDLAAYMVLHAGTIIINLTAFGPNHQSTFTILRVSEADCNELLKVVAEESELGKVIIQALQTINVYNVTKEIEDGLPPNNG